MKYDKAEELADKKREEFQGNNYVQNSDRSIIIKVDNVIPFPKNENDENSWEVRVIFETIINGINPEPIYRTLDFFESNFTKIS